MLQILFCQHRSHPRQVFKASLCGAGSVGSDRLRLKGQIVSGSPRRVHVCETIVAVAVTIVVLREFFQLQTLLAVHAHRARILALVEGLDRGDLDFV